MKGVYLKEIDWDHTDNEPITGSGVTNYNGGITDSTTKASKTVKTFAIGKILIPLGLKLATLACGIAVIVLGAKIMNGQMEAPDMAYETMMGLIFVILGLFLLRFKVRV